MRCGCIILWTVGFGYLPNLTLLAMFPGRWPNYPESMWNYGWSAPSFSSPQPAVPPGQFCGGDMMSQQSQAQSQAQTQAQLAHLREQNSILNQQLASQAQTHIQHLQQLLPFHQSLSTPHPPQSTPPAPEPPTPVAPQSTPPGSSASFNAEDPDDAADEEHGRIQHAGFRGQEPRAQQESSSNSCTTTNSSLSTNSKPSSPIRWSSTTITTSPSSLSLSLSSASFSTWQTSNLCPTKSTSSKIVQTNTSFVSATLVTQETTFHVEKLFETSKQSYLGHITVSLSTSTRSTTW